MPKQLDPELRRKFVDALLKIPVTQTFAGRSDLLNGLPDVALTRSENIARLDLNQIIDGWVRLGRDPHSGIRPLIVIAENALQHIGEWQGDLYTTFQEIMRELELYYGGEPPTKTLPEVKPELLLFKGQDERVSFNFVERALETAKSVARFKVPRIFDGQYRYEGDDMFGTGWLIAPGVLITNHHVIAARERSESPANPEDFQQQAEGVTVWFDYFRERGSYLECQGAELLWKNRDLDYAIIRLKEAEKVDNRKPLPIIEQSPKLQRGDRLNIVQHSRGGPMIYAIRNNFYVGIGATQNFLRYLTDTEGGASGSPILNDHWKVVGLHHAATPIPPEYYVSLSQRYQSLPKETLEGEVITYHNEGIAIHAILQDLPHELRKEIQEAQKCGAMAAVIGETGNLILETNLKFKSHDVKNA